MVVVLEGDEVTNDMFTSDSTYQFAFKAAVFAGMTSYVSTASAVTIASHETATPAPTPATASRRAKEFRRKLTYNTSSEAIFCCASLCPLSSRRATESEHGASTRRSTSLEIKFSVDLGYPNSAMYDSASSTLNSYISGTSSSFATELNSTISAQGVTWTVDSITVTTQAATYAAYCSSGGQGCPAGYGTSSGCTEILGFCSIIVIGAGGGLGAIFAILGVIVGVICCKKKGICCAKKKEGDAAGEDKGGASAVISSGGASAGIEMNAARSNLDGDGHEEPGAEADPEKTAVTDRL